MRGLIQKSVGLVLVMSTLAASENRFDAHGRMQRLAIGPGWIDVKTDLRAPLLGWGKIWSGGDGTVQFTEANGKKYWQSRLGDGERAELEGIQVAYETPTGIEYELKVSALKDSTVEGAIFWIDLPAKIFAGGSFVTSGRDAAGGQLPLTFVDQKTLNSGTLDGATIKNADGSIALTVNWSAPVNASIQDGRQWGDIFSLMIFVHQGTLLKGSTAKLNVVMKTSGAPEQTPAEFSLNAGKTLYKIDGHGGNYCFNLDGPERLRTLEQLKPAYARTEMSLQLWTPVQGVNQSALSPDKMPGKLKLEFEVMRDLSVRKIPFIASIWQAPEWLCVPQDPANKNSNGHFRQLKPGALADAAEAAGTYLLYAKEKLNAEPEYFSFNEPDYGAHVKMTAEEHRDALKVFGAHFKKLGLKTRQLLGDVSNPRLKMDYLQPALDDAEAMQHVGAVSFHSWGGATPEEYGRWPALAERLKLPLFVGEAGVDPGAWKGSSYRTYDYAVREMAHYQDLFQHARPQSILYWEYTGDYSLLASEKNPQSKQNETERFALQRHWLQFIPPQSESLEVLGSNAYVQVTAFKSGEHLTLHLSNTAWPRKVTIKGIPDSIKSLNMIQTTRGLPFKSYEPVSVINGAVELEAPAQGLMTLTTR